MRKKDRIDTSHDAPNRKVSVERVYHASIEDLWELWTTRYGLELWWASDGYAVTVSKVDLRSGGTVEYSETATGPGEIELMKSAGIPTTHDHRITYTEVAPRRHIAYEHTTDPLPGNDAHVEATDVELHSVAHGTSMVVTFDALPDAALTQKAITGWESRLSKLAEVLDA